MRCHVIDKKDVFKSGHRFDAGFHLSNGVTIRRNLLSLPYPSITISDVTSRIHYGIRANRRYVTKREHAIPFMTGANIMLSDINNTKLISKKYAPCVDEMTLHKNWVLITRSGTVGQTAWSNNLFEGKYGSEDIIRVIPNNKIKGGCVYAYLASKYGQSLLTQGSFGAVIQHIEPTFVGNLPIPDFPEDFQDRVDLLVQESAKLREEASEALEEAHHIIEERFNGKEALVGNRTSIKTVICSHNKRFEGFYYTSSNRNTYNTIIEKFKYKMMNELTDRIFRPGIFKRDYVDNGIPFLGGADIMMAIPKSEKKLSFKQVQKMPELKVKRGWILLTCGGTIGNAICVDKQIAKCAISQHVMRIVPKESTNRGYLYAFLSSKIGRELTTLFSYGSVIPQVEPHHLENIPIPMLDTNIMEYIDTLVEKYTVKLENSKEKETSAITMVEQEIEKWNK